jgi:ribosomal protein S18 acetylase RimI-like enzyme/predicted DNA-binding transcriptional regulator
MEYMDELGLLALGSRLRRLSDQIMADGAKVYAQSGIDFDPKWFPIFRLLSTSAPLGIMEISSMLDISHPYAIQLVKALEKKGLVVNVVNKNDARKRAIGLSERGEEVLKKLEPLWKDIEGAMENMFRETNNNLFTNIIQLENTFEEKPFYQRVMETTKQRQNKTVDIVNFLPDLAHYFKSLNVEWLEKYFTVEPIDEQVLGNPVDYIIKPGGVIIFAILNGEVVGTCALKLKEGKTYELTKMAVTEKAQGYQIGKKLGQRIIEIGKERGAEKIYLESNRKLVPALSLYRKLGFMEAVNPTPSPYERSNIYMELKEGI